jgi:hypothetical protein
VLTLSAAAKPEELTASLTQLAYLTARVSTYLAVRLPAEITLPHRGYPLPTIFNPQASYSSRDVPFPGTTPAQSSTNSPAASRILDQRPLPRPRPLFVYSTLAKLAKDDPQAYSMFVEGVTFLAWDIAWLCKTQGMRGLNSEADICPIVMLQKRQTQATRMSLPQRMRQPCLASSHTGQHIRSLDYLGDESLCTIGSCKIQHERATKSRSI